MQNQPNAIPGSRKCSPPWDLLRAVKTLWAVRFMGSNFLQRIKIEPCLWYYSLCNKLHNLWSNRLLIPIRRLVIDRLMSLRGFVGLPDTWPSSNIRCNRPNRKKQMTSQQKCIKQKAESTVILTTRNVKFRLLRHLATKWTSSSHV